MKLIKMLGSQWAAVSYSTVLSFIMGVAVGRTLGPETFGNYGYITSVGTIYAIFQDGGFRTLIFREKTKSSNELARLKPDLLPLALGHVILTTTLGVLLSIALPLKNNSALCIAIFYFGLATTTSFVSSNLKGDGRFQEDSWWQIQVRTWTAIFVLLSLCLRSVNLELIFLGWIAGLAIALAMPLGRAIFSRFIFTPNINVYRSCSAFLVIDAATSLYFRIDMVLLGHMAVNAAEVGYYAAAYRLLEGGIMFMTPAAHICFRLLRLKWQEIDAFSRLLKQMLIGMAGLAAIVLCCTYWFGTEITVIIFGEEYRKAGSLLLWLVVSCFFIFPNFILTQASIAANRERYYAFVAIFAAVLNIALNLWLIPIHGALGSAWATIVTEGALCVLLAINLSSMAVKR